MEGASNEPVTLRPEGTVPEEVQFVLDWNPPLLATRQEASDLPVPQDTAHNTIWYTRPAAFYDKHLASHLILKHVVYLDTLVSAMESTVDQAIQDASNVLPKNSGALPTPPMIRDDVIWSNWSPYNELGVAEIYSAHTARYCQPIASTLAIHPSSEKWRTSITWSVDRKEVRWAIADGELSISANVNKDDHPIQELL